MAQPKPGQSGEEIEWKSDMYPGTVVSATLELRHAAGLRCDSFVASVVRFVVEWILLCALSASFVSPRDRPQIGRAHV